MELSVGKLIGPVSSVCASVRRPTVPFVILNSAENPAVTGV